MKKISMGLLTIPVILISILLASCSNADEYVLLMNQPRQQVTDDDQRPDIPFAMTMNEAQQRLEQLMKAEQGTMTRGYEMPKITSRYAFGGKKSITRSTAEGADSTNMEDSPLVYVFNFGEKDGFAVMAGDQRLPVILAQMGDGELKPDMEIENIGVLCMLKNAEDSYKQELAAINKADAGIKAGNTYITTVDSVIHYYPNEQPEGMCNVHWHQKSPYNAYCPIQNGQHCLVGCAAVAVGQLMSIYKWPLVYGQCVFNWDDMIEETPEGINQTALLLNCLGLGGNLSMNYGLNGSASNIDYIPRTFQNFGYSHCGSVIDYSAPHIIGELMSGCPIILTGYKGMTITQTNVFGQIINVISNMDENTGHTWLGHGLKVRTTIIKYYDKTTNQLIKSTSSNSYFLKCNFGWNIENYDPYCDFNIAFGNFRLEPDVTVPRVLFPDGYYYSATTINNYGFNQQLVVGIRKI